MARARARIVCQNSAGDKLVGAQVSVYTVDTQTPISASIYADKSGGAPVSNPLTADANGIALFYLDAPQQVDVRVVGGGVDVTIPDVPVLPDQGAWTDFTPTVTQVGAVTATVTYARYTLLGKTALVQLGLVLTSAGTTNNDVVVGNLPAAIAPKQTGDFRTVGHGIYCDTGAAVYRVTAEAASASTIKLRQGTTGNYLGKDPNIATANTDEVHLDLSYEVA